MGMPRSKQSEPDAGGKLAQEWMVLLQDSALTGEQKAAYVRWLKQSPAHIRAMLELFQVGELLRNGKDDSSSQEPTSSVVALRSALVSQLRGFALSSTYLAHFRKHNRIIRIVLGSLSLALFILPWLGLAATIPAANLCAGFFVIVALKEAVVGYRVSRGFFGSTDAEARTLIRFLVENSDRIDFDDFNGRRRPAFEQTPPEEPGTLSTGAVTE